MKNRTLIAGLSLSGVSLVGLSLDAIGQAAYPLTHENKFDAFAITASSTTAEVQNTITGDTFKVVSRDLCRTRWTIAS